MEVVALFVLGSAYAMLCACIEVWKTAKITRETGRNRYIHRGYRLMSSRWK